MKGLSSFSHSSFKIIPKMRHLTQLAITIIASLVFTCQANAQFITSKTTPEELEAKLQLSRTETIPTHYIPALTDEELKILAREDEEASMSNAPYRFATLVETDITPENAGIWSVQDNRLTWTLEIYAEKATSLSITFKELKLPDGSEIYIYTADKRKVMGPLNNQNFPQLEEISTDVLPGDRIVFVYIESKEDSQNRNIHLSKIGYGYRDFSAEELMEDPDRIDYRSSSCQVEVIDNRGDCYRLEQRGVAKMLFNSSSYWCDATMINNTNFNSNLNPYLLIAEHCTKNNAGVDIYFPNVLFRFRNWQGASSTVTYSGSTLRAKSDARADFGLVELSQIPSAAEKIFYLGWTRNTSAPTNSTVIHNPGSETMKILRDGQTALNHPTALNGTIANGTWAISTGQTSSGDFGLTEGGSSGAALLNQDHKIQGNLSSGNNSCSFLQGSEWYGKFNVSWDGDGTAATRLKDWLDPTNTNAQDILSTFKFANDVSSAIPCINLNQDVSAPLLQTNGGTKYTYTWLSSSNIAFTGTGETVTFKAINSRSVGTNEWIECEIRTPAACGNQLIARSVRKNLTWVDQTGAFIKATNTANGQVIGVSTAIPLNNCRTYNVSFESIPVPNTVSFNWSFTGNTSSFYNSISNNGKTITICCYGSGSITANVQVVNGSGCLVGVSKNYGFIQGSWLSSPSDTYLAKNEDNQPENIKVFPNPTGQGNVILQLPQNINPNNTIIAVSDIYGRILQKRKPEGIYQQIDVSSFSNGIYLIEVNDGTYHYTTRLIVKE